MELFDTVPSADRGVRLCGLPGGIPIVWRDDIHRWLSGVVYQKDLGKKTDVLAKAMKEYNPQFQLAKG